MTLWRRGTRFDGTLHLTQHHLIFSYVPLPQAGQPASDPAKPRELWITYPMIAFCTYRPAPAASRQQPCIRVRCRDFTYAAFHFLSERQAQDVFETIRNLTCRLSRLEQLYAFTYQPQGPEKHVNGWTIYNPMQEWRRLGVGSKGANKGWRISQINSYYEYSPTYPALLPVPVSISDNVLNYAGRYRSRVRIPVLTYLHPVNDCSISRSSQPLVGVRGNRSAQDEKLVASIFATSNSSLSTSESFGSDKSGDSAFQSRTSSGTHTPRLSHEPSNSSLEKMEDEAIAHLSQKSGHDSDEPEAERRLYGAQQNNLIVDARPTVNAFAMQAVGMGSENMDHYPFATKAYLGIDNIHVMRDSLNKVVDALKDSDITPLPPNRELLAKSNWLKHISNMLDGAGLIARQVGIHHSHVLIHCSDGWDRTSQLSALSQLCLDPYYRTMEGFMVLVEKDFVSFGHMFRHRSGFLGSEKWFEIENERIGGPRSGSESPFGGSSARVSVGGNNAFENALLSAKGFFNKHNLNHESRENLSEADELPSYNEPSSPARAASPSPRKASGADEPSKPVTKVKETSPMFHQFLDATFQLVSQHPTRFEFNERFLKRLLYHLYSCQYGTFLYDSEKQRIEARVKERTRSAWDYFLARKDMFMNKTYVPNIDDNVRGQERLIFPDLKKVKWWAEVFGRTDEEMNSPPSRPPEPLFDTSSDSPPQFESASNSTLLHDVNESEKNESLEEHPINAENSALEGVETSSDAQAAGLVPSAKAFPATGLGLRTASTGHRTPSTAGGAAAIAAGLTSMNLSTEVGADTDATHGQSKRISHPLEVEMQ